MIQIIPEWRVEIIFDIDEDNLMFWVSDAYISNVLRLIIAMRYHRDSLRQPKAIRVELVPMIPSAPTEKEPQC